MNNEGIYEQAENKESNTKKLFDYVRSIRDDGTNVSFCRRAYLEGFRGHLGINKRLEEVIKPSKILNMQRDYAYLIKKITFFLPPCRNCHCLEK